MFVNHGTKYCSTDQQLQREKVAFSTISVSPERQALSSKEVHVLKNLLKHRLFSAFFFIMADKCMDVANREQFVVCICWVDETLTDHEDVIGVCNVGTIDADALTCSNK